MIYINEILEKRCIIDGEMELAKNIMNKRNISNYFNKEHKIQDKMILERLSDIAFIKKVKRHEILVKQGEVPKYLLFQIKGIVGGYYVDEKGKYHMELFSGQYKLPIAATYHQNDISPVTLEALTKGEIIIVPKEAFRELSEAEPELMKVSVYMLLEALALQTELKRVLLYYDVKKRYEWFVREYPELNGKISNRYVASFLNMTPETLSRVKKELQREEGSDSRTSEIQSQ